MTKIYFKELQLVKNDQMFTIRLYSSKQQVWVVLKLSLIGNYMLFTPITCIHVHSVLNDSEMTWSKY